MITTAFTSRWCAEVEELFKEKFQRLTRGKWVSGKTFKVGVILVGYTCRCMRFALREEAWRGNGTPAAPRGARRRPIREIQRAYSSIVLIKYNTEHSTI